MTNDKKLIFKIISLSLGILIKYLNINERN
jgi:hypothetical protein